MKNIKVIIPIILILVGLGVGFFGGYEYRNYRLRRTAGNFTGANGARFTGRNGTPGSILSMDDKSITVKLLDGSSKIVFFSDSTIYTNTTTASKADLKVGENVAVIGSVNSDGSVTAQDIQLNPQFRGATPSPTPAK